MEDTVCIKDFESLAKERLSTNAWNYYSSGADEQRTLNENEHAFSKLRIRPRMLRGVGRVDTSAEIIGGKVGFPIGISPTAMQKMAHPDGELATVRAAKALGVCMTLSSWSTSSIEEVADAATGAIKWFQLYIYKDKNITLDLARRAELSGYKALAVTVDTPVLGRRVADVRHKFQLPGHLDLANYRRAVEETGNVADARGSGLAAYVAKNIDTALSWQSVDWLRSETDLPIILKGILTAADALEAAKHGVQGILVSNHGGRQLDGVPATIEALPEIVRAVGQQMDVYLDGGVRSGTDAFKAIAIGAKAVFFGRPALWGLACGGEEGVKKVLQIYKEEFERCMILAGCKAISDISADMVVHESYYWKSPKSRM